MILFILFCVVCFRGCYLPCKCSATSVLLILSPNQVCNKNQPHTYTNQSQWKEIIGGFFLCFRPPTLLTKHSTQLSFFFENSLRMDSCNSTCLVEEGLSTKTMILIPFSLLIGVPCTVLNTFVLVIFVAKRALRDNIYYCLVLLLSFSDLLVGLGYISYSFQNTVSQTEGFAKVMCILKTAFVTSGTLMSVWQSFVIALQRYLVLFHMEWNKRLFTGVKKYLVCSLIWLVILMFTVGLISPQQEYNSNVICHVEYVYEKHFDVFITFSRCIAAIVLLTIVSYCVVLRYVIRIRKRKVFPVHQPYIIQVKPIPQHPPQGESGIQTTSAGGTQDSTSGCQSNSLGRKEVMTQSSLTHQIMSSTKKKKLTNTIVLVGLLLGCHTLLTAPFFISLLFPETPNTLIVISACLCGINSIINPILYCMKIESVRCIVRNIFSCKWPKCINNFVLCRIWVHTGKLLLNI